MSQHNMPKCPIELENRIKTSKNEQFSYGDLRELEESLYKP